MRDYKTETEKRVNFIKQILKDSGATGIVFGNSGGKDSALVGILCKLACKNTFSVIMPCESRRNFDEDKKDGLKLSSQYDIETIVVDITQIKKDFVASISPEVELSSAALMNINPRIRMTTLYAIAQSRNSLVAGTGNRSEGHMGYFTKWGDGAYDFNPIYDLTATEIWEFLKYLEAPIDIIQKAPSAGLFDGQTDEKEMGITYRELDDYLQGKKISEDIAKKIEDAHKRTEHKRNPAIVYKG